VLLAAAGDADVLVVVAGSAVVVGERFVELGTDALGRVG
jgi:hypothetical protein